jgi:hypothetical protein
MLVSYAQLKRFEERESCWGQCYDFKNIFAKNIDKNIGLYSTNS